MRPRIVKVKLPFEKEEKKYILVGTYKTNQNEQRRNY